MIVDFHVHAFPKVVRNNRELYFFNEPDFRLLYELPRQKLVGISEIIRMMDDNEIGISVIFGFPWKNYNICRKNNDYVIDAVQKYPNRFKGFCCVDPQSNMAEKEVERCLDAGLSGVGELAFYSSEVDENCLTLLNPIMSICRLRNVPVILHTNEEVGAIYPGKTCITMNQVYNLIKHFPKNKIVLSHWGGGIFFFNLLKREAKKVFSNIYYDIAASPFLYESRIYGIAKNIIGVDKILFGTDFPLIEPSRYLAEMIEGGLNESDMQKICFKNAERLLEL